VYVILCREPLKGRDGRVLAKQSTDGSQRKAKCIQQN
jgi:hypothetical protein